MPSRTKAHQRPRARELAYLVDVHGSGRKVAAALGIPHTTVATWIRQLKAGTYDDSESLTSTARAAGVPPPGAIPPQPEPPPRPQAPSPSIDLDADKGATRAWLLQRVGGILEHPDTTRDALQAAKMVADWTEAAKRESATDEAGTFSPLEAGLFRQARRLLASRVGRWLEGKGELRHLPPDELAARLEAEHSDEILELLGIEKNPDF